MRPQRLPHVLVARERIEIVARQPDHRTGVAQRPVMRIGLGEHLVAIQIDVVRGDRAAHVRALYSAMTGLRSTPIPDTSTSTTSPGFMNSGGLRFNPTPPGV